MESQGSGKTAIEKTRPVVSLNTSMGNIVIEFDPVKAPITVKNFLGYVEGGYYDGLIFHRVIPGFMIQGGGMKDDMASASPGKAIKNESDNGLSNMRGTIAMARTSDPDSATSQFFINQADNTFLDYKPGKPGYAVFGHVISGMDVVDKIAKVDTGYKKGHSDVPEKAVFITKVAIIKAGSDPEAVEE
ncbi:peptidylprolyl isomerase [Endozoicomonas sp. Mp262]